MLLGLGVDRTEQRHESRVEVRIAGADMVDPAIAGIRRLIERGAQQGVQPLAIAISHDRLPSADHQLRRTPPPLPLPPMRL